MASCASAGFTGRATDLRPTTAALLEPAIGLLDERAADEVTVDLVLSTSRVSKGSLYHHCRDFHDLLDQAQGGAREHRDRVRLHDDGPCGERGPSS